MADVHYYDEFKLLGSNKKLPAGRGPKAASATTSAVDKQGKEWHNPYEWIASFDVKSIKKQLTRLLVGNGFCPICHRDKVMPQPSARCWLNMI